MKQHLTISEVASMIGVNPQTLRRWDKSGKFQSKRHPINNYRVYTKKQVTLLLKEFPANYNIANNKKINIIPFYKTELGILYNIEAVRFFQNLKDESVDLIFADPPYNIKKADWDSFKSQQKYIEWSMEWINEAYRVLSPIGSLYICGFSEILADLKWSANSLFAGCKWLIWFYRNKANLGNDWGRSHESILHFRKSKKFIFNIDKVRIPYNAHTLKYPTRPQAETSQYANGNKKYIWTPHPLGAKPKDIFEIPTISNSAWEKTSHPTQKPIELLRRIISASSNPESIVVDPFGGSGTTYAVAEALGRRWFGAELNLEYCKIIKKRLDNKKNILRIIDEYDEYKLIKRRKRLRGIN